MEMTHLPMLKVLEASDRVVVVKDGLLCEVFDLSIAWRTSCGYSMSYIEYRI